MEKSHPKYLIWDALSKIGSQARLADELGISFTALLRYMYEDEEVPEQVAARAREILKSAT